MSDPALMSLRIVWGSLLISQLLLLVVLNVVAPLPEGPEAMLLPALGVAALSAAGASLVLPKVVFRGALSRLNIDKVEIPDPHGLPGFNKTVTVARDPQRAFRQVLAPYTSRVIVACALGEAVSLMGFVLKFQGFEWIAVAPFFVVGIALCAVQFPSRQRCLSEAEAALGFPLKAT